MLILGIILTVAALASVVITPMVARVAAGLEIYDAPDGDRRVHTRPVPRVGGVAVFVASVLGLSAWALVRVRGSGMSAHEWNFLFGVVSGGAILFVAGLVDDVRGLRPAAKLVAQVAAASAVYALGLRVELLSLGNTSQLALGWLSFPLTLVWIVGVTNAFNLIDGLDGLATGIALVALTTTLLVAVSLGNMDVVVVCVAMIGALLGFLVYNFNPARIFLGDSGSLYVGFMLAVLSIHGSLKSATAVLTIVPLFALALPLLDTSLAVVRRFLRGVPLATADARHIHHRLLALGLTQRRAVLVMYVLATVLAILGVALAFAPPRLVMGVALIGGGGILVLLLRGMRYLEYHEFAEAAVVLASSLPRLRRVIRDQIHARDVAHEIRNVGTREEITAILEDNANGFGFLHMELCREMSRGRGRMALGNGQAAHAWKLDYPVTPHDAVEDDLYVLRIWCDATRSSRPFGAERVARILAPVIEEWLDAGYPRVVTMPDTQTSSDSARLRREATV